MWKPEALGLPDRIGVAQSSTSCMASVQSNSAEGSFLGSNSTGSSPVHFQNVHLFDRREITAMKRISHLRAELKRVTEERTS